ncbi:GNAT family N-acetyltransferase [Nocardioidaceae bacterium]|nr:GNAT family N-acetyltransferase [Nocardioidaceae bacterium]
MSTPPRPDLDDLRLTGLTDLGGDPSTRLDEFIDAVARGFHETVSDDDRALWRSTTQPERSFGIRGGEGAAEKWVATMAAFDRVLTVPGGEFPICAISEVTVAPAYRRRGLLTRMMRHQLQDARARGEAAAYLWVSEQAIYGRFGFGEATRRLTLEVDTRRGAFEPRVDLGDGVVDEVDRDTALQVVPEVFERLRPRTPGWLDRPGPWWEAATYDAEGARGGAGPLRFVLHWNAAGEVDGYAHFRCKEGGPDSEGELRVSQLVAATPQARARLWRLLLDVDLMPRLTTRFGGPAEPLPWWLADRDGSSERLRSGTFLRLVDVEAALAARTYATEVDTVIDVRDTLLPENAGHLRLRGGREGAEVARVDSAVAADVALDVRDLGSAYLGGVDLRTLHRAGLVDGSTAAVGHLAAALQHDVPAECLDMF